MIAYGVFFGAFDISRRVGLGAKGWLTARDASLNGAIYHPDGNQRAPTKARIAQAGCLITGGITASLLAEYVSRPFRKMESVIKKRERQSSGLEFKGRSPGVGGVMKAYGGTVGSSSSLASSYRAFQELRQTQGLRSLFQNEAASTINKRSPEYLALPRRTKVAMAAGRLGWKLVGVGPWGFGFLVFAYLGGEV